MLQRNRLDAQQAGRGPSQAARTCSTGPRARTLEAMIATVSYRGYDRTTVERVLHVAGMPGAVFDEHFTSKEDCFLQALDALLAQTERTVLETLQRTPLWPERVRLGLSALLGALAADPDGARVVLVESFGAGPAASERAHALLRVFPPLLEEGRLHCANPNHLPPGIVMVGGIAAVMHRRVLEDRAGELPRLCGDLAYFALLPYLGHHRAIAAAYV